MLKNLKAEMVRNDVSIAAIAKEIKKSNRGVRDNLNGKYEFDFSEAVAIRDAFFPDMTLEYLFASEDKQVKAD